MNIVRKLNAMSDPPGAPCQPLLTGVIDGWIRRSCLCLSNRKPRAASPTLLRLILLPVIALFAAQVLRAQTRLPQAPVLQLTIPHSDNPFGPYMGTEVPAASLTNSPRLNDLIRDGKLYLSLEDAIMLALENNLDIDIARYNLPIAAADILRTKAGGVTRGINTGIVQNTLGGGVGGMGAGAPTAGAGSGAGGTSSGAGGAGSGASGLVSSTLGLGTAVSSYDPSITGLVTLEHYTEPLSNQRTFGVPFLQQNTVMSQWEFRQAFPTGGSLMAVLENNRVTQNSPFTYLTPALNSYYHVQLVQPLLAGFGRQTNLRYLRIARNDTTISDAAFRDQVITTITQIADIYWDLKSAYADEQAKERSLAFAQATLKSDRQQLKLQAIPALDVTRAQGDVAQRDVDLTIARTNLQLQESLIKNALTRNLESSALEEMPVIPVEKIQVGARVTTKPLSELVAEALQNRPELAEQHYNLKNLDITRKSARNALLPSVDLEAYYGGSGLAGISNPASGIASTVPTDFGGSLQRAFDNSSPDYLVGVSVSIPIRNRVAKSDQYRSELEYRQAQLGMQQLQKQIRIEVRNAQYALEQSVARVQAAREARDLAEKSFTISKAEAKLGAGSTQQTLATSQELSVADSSLAAAEANYEKSRVELARATGTTLAMFHVSMADAKSGIVKHAGP